MRDAKALSRHVPTLRSVELVRASIEPAVAGQQLIVMLQPALLRLHTTSNTPQQRRQNGRSNWTVRRSICESVARPSKERGKMQPDTIPTHESSTTSFHPGCEELHCQCKMYVDERLAKLRRDENRSQADKL